MLNDDPNTASLFAKILALHEFWNHLCVYLLFVHLCLPIRCIICSTFQYCSMYSCLHSENIVIMTVYINLYNEIRPRCIYTCFTQLGYFKQMLAELKLTVPGLHFKYILVLQKLRLKYLQYWNSKFDSLLLPWKMSSNENDNVLLHGRYCILY